MKKMILMSKCKENLEIEQSENWIEVKIGQEDEIVRNKMSNDKIIKQNN